MLYYIIYNYSPSIHFWIQSFVSSWHEPFPSAYSEHGCFTGYAACVCVQVDIVDLKVCQHHSSVLDWREETEFSVSF